MKIEQAKHPTHSDGSTKYWVLSAENLELPFVKGFPPESACCLKARQGLGGRPF